MYRFVWMLCLLWVVGMLVACTEAAPTLLPTPVMPTAVADNSQPDPTTAPAATTTTTDDLLPTPTLAATSTAVVTPTPLPQTDPPLATPDAALPPITRDLLLIGDGALKVWDKDLRRVDVILPGGDEAAVGEQRREVGPIAGDITGYSTSDSGRSIVAAQLTVRDTVTETMPLNQYALIHVDLSDRSPRVLLPNAVNLWDFAISGDGRYALAITTTGMELTDLDRYPGAVFLIDIGSGQATQVADCPQGCSGVAWHPDSQNVVWGDLERGLFLLNVASDSPQLLIAHQRAESGITAVDTTLFSPISFARNGQFLLAWQNGERVVVDLPSAQVLVVPNTQAYADAVVAQVTWMDDNRLFVVRPQMPQSPIADIFRPVPEQGQLVLEESMVLPVPGTYPLGAAHLENGRFGFALIRPGDTAVSGLYILKGIGDDLDRVNGALPSADAWVSSSVWSADGSGALLKQGDMSLYGATLGDALFDMRPAFGSVSSEFQWLPPRPR